MINITEDFVSFETAKLLKEKGFNGILPYIYIDTENSDKKPHLLDTLRNYNDGNIKNVISAPTLQIAMKWLREVHNCYIEICIDNSYDFKDIVFRPAIYDKKLDCLWESDNFLTYKEACEAAIKYCLENLI